MGGRSRFDGLRASTSVDAQPRVDHQSREGVETREVAHGVFVVTDAGVVVFDAPETYATTIRTEVEAATSQPITTLVYTHMHNDHIGGSAAFADIARDVYDTVKRLHGETDLMAVFADTAEQIGGFDNKYLLFDRFLEVVTARVTAEIEQRWMDRLAGIDVFAEDHVRAALIYVRWDD
jgi:glyoxylase-like metal-dependent hydrolase (beta-lactamase superfamily II)